MERAGAGVKLQIVSSIAPLLLIFIAWGVLNLMTYLTVQKDTELQAQIVSNSAILNSDKATDNIVDLQSRLSQIKLNLASKIEVDEVLNEMAKTVVAGVTFSSYTHTDKKLLITLNASNFDIIAKQIFNFKQTEFLSSVEVSQITRDMKGIKCDVEMILK